MKKEKWLIQEIESWQQSEIISKETADRLKTMYQPKKGIGLLMVLFSVIGSVLIGMGIVLVSANNWWYSLPIAVRAFIGFLPLLISQAVVLFVYRYKMHSIAFRESAALLNVAGVFASIALVGQIFHIAGDFTNYLLVCGVLFLPIMLIMNAISPLIIYYWTAINGGACFSDELGIIISAMMFAVGAVFALSKCRVKNGRSVYLSLITVISAFVMMLIWVMNCYNNLVLMLYGYTLLLLSASTMLKGAEGIFATAGRICFIVLTFVATYRGFWGNAPDFDNVAFVIMTVAILIGGLVLCLKNIRAKNYCLFSVATLAMLILWGIWAIFGLTSMDAVFMIVANIILLVLSILFIFDGAKRVDLHNANAGMVILCTLIILRFFDSGLSLVARGVVFLVLGAGFLLFNLYLVKTKKRIKEESI